MITLGIPSFNRFDLLVRCIDSALASRVAPDVIYVVDNSGHQYPAKWQDRYAGRVLVHVAPSNYGVAKSWNILISIAPGEDIILSNDDIAFAPDTIQLLLAEAERNRRAGIVSAIEGQRFALFWLNRTAYEEVGPFDEQFYPAYFEDNDYHRRLTLAHWESPIAFSAVAHETSATYKAKDQAAQSQHHQDFRRCRELYIRKWGGLPGEEIYTTPYGENRV
jgi:GT2 family glycosyltransferase